jgi:phage-related protein
MVLLHGFTKASQKTRKADLKLALERQALWEKAQ